MESTDFLEFLADDRATRVIALYCEQIRRPREFLAACRRARAAGKPVVLMLPGRGAKSRRAAQSHTGALVGDYAVVRTQVEDAGALVVSTIDEFMDVLEILSRYPEPPTKGPGILTASGAFVALTNDFAEDLELDLPELHPETLRRVREVLPSYGNYGNPLDVTAGFAQEELPSAVKALIDDPNVGMLFISFPINVGSTVRNFNKGMRDSPKPKVMVALGDTWPLASDVIEAANESPAVFSRSSDRMLRAIALYTRYGRLLARSRAPASNEPFAGLPKLGNGARTGMARQEGPRSRRHPRARRRSCAHTGRCGRRRHARRLSGRSQGAVRQAVAQDRGGRRRPQPRRRKSLRTSWDTMMAAVTLAAPGVVLDGALVEKMSPKGIELMVGAKRDPLWGIVLLIGLGGIWVEALADVQVLPGDADKTSIVEALRNCGRPSC